MSASNEISFGQVKVELFVKRIDTLRKYYKEIQIWKKRIIKRYR